MSDSGTDSATNTVTGTMAGGVTFGTTTSDADGFTDTDHEQDGDTGVTDSASDNDSGSDGGSETYIMHEGGPITDSSGGLDDASLSTDDSFSGLTGTYSLTDTMNDSFGDSGSGSVADSGSDTLTDASWSAGISGGDSGADDDHGGETVTYNANASGTSGSFTDYEQDISTYSDHDAGSDATVSDTATSQDTLTATDGGSVINSYSSTETSTAAFNGTGTTTTSNTISESDSDGYSDIDIDGETVDATGSASPTSNDDTHTDDGQSSYSLNESTNSHCSSISLTSSESEDGNGSYDDSSENVDGAVTFSNNDSGFSEGDTSSVSITASFGSSVTVADTETTDDTFTYTASGSTSDGTTGYTTLSYFDDSYVYTDGSNSANPDYDLWASRETITNINGGGADYTTDTTIYNDGSVVTGGGGDDGIGRFGGGGFGGGGEFGGGGFHSDLYGGGGGSETETETDSSTPPTQATSAANSGSILLILVGLTTGDDAPVTHHWSPISVLNSVRDLLSDEAYKVALGSYSGELDHIHGFETHNGITHFMYNTAVREQFDKYIKANGITAESQMTAKQMKQLGDRLASGRGYDGKLLPKNSSIPLYNAGITSTMLREKQNLTTAQLILNGEKYAKRNPRRIIGLGMAGALMTQIVPGVGQVASAVTNPQNREKFMTAMKRYAEGKDTVAEGILAGEGNSLENPNGGLFSDLAGEIGLSGAHAFMGMVIRARDQARAGAKKAGIP